MPRLLVLLDISIHLGYLASLRLEAEMKHATERYHVTLKIGSWRTGVARDSLLLSGSAAVAMSQSVPFSSLENRCV